MPFNGKVKISYVPFKSLICSHHHYIENNQVFAAPILPNYWGTKGLNIADEMPADFIRLDV